MKSAGARDRRYFGVIFRRAPRRQLNANPLAGQLRRTTCQAPQLNIYFRYIFLWGAIMDTAKIFQNGKSQAIRLPKDYRFRGSKVYLKRIGNAVVLIPEQDSWQTLLESLDQFSDDFMAERQQPPVQERVDLFE